MIYGKIGKRFEGVTIENYKCPPGCEEARAACRAFIAGSTEGLLLMGKVGTGKTHLLAAVALAFHQDADTRYEKRDGIDVAISNEVKTVAFYPMLDLVAALRDDVRNKSRRTIKQCLSADLMVLDDLGVERSTEFIAEELAQIINGRYDAMKPIAVSTNLTIQGIKERYSDRALSRWAQTCERVEMKQADFRIGSRPS